jgi:hypothetical protein
MRSDPSLGYYSRNIFQAQIWIVKDIILFMEDKSKVIFLHLKS